MCVPDLLPAEAGIRECLKFIREQIHGETVTVGMRSRMARSCSFCTPRMVHVPDPAAHPIGS
jgi:hypothetical protein